MIRARDAAAGAHPTTECVPLAGLSLLLVSRDPVASRERRLLEDHGCLVVHAPEGRPAHWLHSGRSRAALVRPDRAVHLSHPRTSVVTAAGLGVVMHGML